MNGFDRGRGGVIVHSQRVDSAVSRHFVGRERHVCLAKSRLTTYITRSDCGET